MPKMIALAKFRYPSGPTGKEYSAGDEVEILSDRDAKALRLVKRAKDAPTKPDYTEELPKGSKSARPKLEPAPAYRTADLTAEKPAAAAPSTPSSTQTTPKPTDTVPATAPKTYKREDLVADGGNK